MTKEEKKKKEILTENRKITINKHEVFADDIKTSQANLSQSTTPLSLEKLIRQDKNQKLIKIAKISSADLENIPALLQIREAINNWKKTKRTYIVNKAIIDLAKDQYILREAVRNPVQSHNHLTISSFAESDIYSALNFANQDFVKYLLKYYTSLRTEKATEIQQDIYWILEDFDTLLRKGLQEKNEIYYQIVLDKFADLSLLEIKEDLNKRFNLDYTIEYISTLFNIVIPKMLVDFYKENHYIWELEVSNFNNWKTCTHCGRTLPKTSAFFNKDSSNKSGFYSVCKECRKKKRIIKKKKR